MQWKGLDCLDDDEVLLFSDGKEGKLGGEIKGWDDEGRCWGGLDAIPLLWPPLLVWISLRGANEDEIGGCCGCCWAVVDDRVGDCRVWK